MKLLTANCVFACFICRRRTVCRLGTRFTKPGPAHRRGRVALGDRPAGARRSAGGPDQTAAGLPYRGFVGRRAERARHGALAEGHSLYRQPRRSRLRARTAKRTRSGAPRDRFRPGNAGGRGVARRRALCLRGVENCTLRCDRYSPERSAQARRRDRYIAHGDAPRLEIHRVRPGRQAVRAARRAVQRLPERSQSLRTDRPHGCGRQSLRSGGARHPQFGRLRMASA